MAKGRPPRAPAGVGGLAAGSGTGHIGTRTRTYTSTHAHPPIYAHPRPHPRPPTPGAVGLGHLRDLFFARGILSDRGQHLHHRLGTAAPLLRAWRGWLLRRQGYARDLRPASGFGRVVDGDPRRLLHFIGGRRSAEDRTDIARQRLDFVLLVRASRKRSDPFENHHYRPRLLQRGPATLLPARMHVRLHEGVDGAARADPDQRHPR
mmetsp:Transcript_34857/g.93146  ORF Transcript_34857/g.93146 Transcript_34857/m.93146 type:complete len:206 (+) Transcript_34857:472-1089(+)